jgi:hypothetical protein
MEMGISLALIVMGTLIFLERMGVAYSLKEGWPWVIVALGVGGLYKNTRSVAGWLATVVGVLILGTKYYSVHLGLPPTVKTFFLPVLLILVGLLCLFKFKKD